MAGCKSGPMSVAAFNPLENIFVNDSAKTLNIDFENAIDSGIIIPSIKQTSGGYLKFSFKIKNNNSSACAFYYKIYYQNKSYKFLEYQIVDNEPREDIRCSQNFYGSWEQPNYHFKKTKKIPPDGKYHVVTDSFRIVGNPRNEKKYYGGNRLDRYIFDSEIKKTINEICSDSARYNAVVLNATAKKVAVQSMLKYEAEKYLTNLYQNTNNNNRWKRNPRTGLYEFMLVVASESGLNNIPQCYKDISINQPDSTFLNPYYYFLYSRRADTNEVLVYKSNQYLNVVANLPLYKGVYVNKKIKDLEQLNLDYKEMNHLCNCDSNMYFNASIEQFFHSINKNDSFSNIPLIKDIINSTYSYNEYESDKQQHLNKLSKATMQISKYPCRTTFVDSTGAITIINPGSKVNKQKENVGIVTRYGFTYGKFRVKAKLSKLLNSNNVWCGLTNAIWLITQDTASWNYRSSCYNKGYIPKHINGETNYRKQRLGYSEIDFEILKTSAVWPKTSYRKGYYKNKDNQNNNNIIVTCTNWDMACASPVNFGIGVSLYDKMNTKMELHRWDHWYKALTVKSAQSDNELFGGNYYWFEIEWKPEEIIWRIGPEKNKMRVVAYMNNKVTTIPDNQMILVITQEFHLTEWWPESLYEQHLLPFPLNDLKGKIFAIEIE